MAEVLQGMLVDVMDRWNLSYPLDPLRKLPWESLDPISRALYIERCEAFLERYDVRAISKPSQV